MPSKLPVDENMVFLFKCIEASGCKMDFKMIADAVGIKPPAARMRYTRLKKSVESGSYVPNRSMDLASSSSGEQVVGTPNSTPKRKHAPTKLMDESSEEGEEELEPIKKKKLAIQKVVSIVPDASCDDTTSDDEVKKHAKNNGSVPKKIVERHASYSGRYTDELSYYTAKEVLPKEDDGDDRRWIQIKNATSTHDKALPGDVVPSGKVVNSRSVEKAHVHYGPPTIPRRLRDIRADIEPPDTMQRQKPGLSMVKDDQFDLDARFREEMETFLPGLRVGTVHAQTPPISFQDDGRTRIPVSGRAGPTHYVSDSFGEDEQSIWSQGGRDMISPDDSISAVGTRTNAIESEEQISISNDRKRSSSGSMIARITSLWG